MKTRFFASANPLLAAHAAVIAGASTLGHIKTSTDFAIDGTGILTFAVTQPNTHSWAAIQEFRTGVSGTLLRLDSTTPLNRDVVWTTNGTVRWTMRVNSTAEGGSNAGSDFQLLSRDDAGALIAGALVITRSSSAAVFAGNLSASNINTAFVGGAGTAALLTTTQTFTGDKVFTPSATGVVPVTITGNASTSVDLARVFTSGGIGVLVDKNGHLATTTAAPAGVVGTGAGTSPSAVVATGSNQSGTLTLTTGTSIPASSQTVMTVTFSGTGFTTAPKSVQIFPANLATAALAAGAQAFVSAFTATTFTVTSGATGLGGSTAYKWTYLAV